MIDVLQFVVLLFIATTVWDKDHPITALRRGKGNKVIVDTCALIDGRLVQLCEAGFTPGELIIPEFIIHELQLLADGADAQKRERARFGLDVVQQLQDNPTCHVTIDRSPVAEKPAVDDKLVALAKSLGARLYTTDFNLNKVAGIEGVKVLNINELAQHLRTTALPGEKKSVKVIQKGSNAKQGVGYLDDGTMLVVEDGAEHIGDTVEVEITRVHQTVAGKMLFGVFERHEKKKTAAVMGAATKSAPRMAARKPASHVASRMKRFRRPRVN